MPAQPSQLSEKPVGISMQPFVQCVTQIACDAALQSTRSVSWLSDCCGSRPVSRAQFGRTYGFDPQSSFVRSTPAVTHEPDEDDDELDEDDDELDDDDVEGCPLLLDEDDDVKLPLLDELLLLSSPELEELPASGMSSNETRSEQPAAAIVKAAPRAS